jgi:hypothetical protein
MLARADVGQALAIRRFASSGQSIRSNFGLSDRPNPAGLPLEVHGRVDGPMAVSTGPLVDQAVLKREQSEQQVAVSGGHDNAPISGGRTRELPAFERLLVIDIASAKLSQFQRFVAGAVLNVFLQT